MDILYLLIPMSALLVLALLGVFGWALHRGQFDDLDDEGRRILGADDASLDQAQARAGRSPQESP
jgi:cbb3-type cytochrome oxidase maturation protein